MNWPGKADCFKTIQRPSFGTLRPCPEDSVSFNTSENLIIEGDNLEVLKLLQKSYLGKVKMIYIDPPYNTGNDFIYPDNYAESLQTYLEYTGQLDAEGRKFGTNTEADGRFHSKWLNMIYPRLYLARNLLTDDGVIFISIDDHEVTRLKMVCDELFGEENFIDTIIWKKRYQGAKEKFLASIHEYILFYAKNIEAVPPIFIPSDPDYIDKYYKYKDAKYHERGAYRTQPLEAGRTMDARKNLIYPIPAPDGTEILPKRQWVWGKDRVFEALNKGELEYNKSRDGQWTVGFKQYLKDEEGNTRETKAFSIIDDIYTQHGTAEVADLMGSQQIFSFPKPTQLIQRLMQMGLDKESEIILDFFAGSATTAHSVMNFNLEHKTSHKYILVQLPERLTENSEAFKCGFTTISEIAKERIRRTAKKIVEENDEQLDLIAQGKPDFGFKVFKLAESNVTTWDAQVAHDPTALEKQLEFHVDHIRVGRTPEDILYELLLKSGFPLTTLVEKQILAGKTVYSVADGALMICLERELSLELIRAIAERKPERVICLDEGFAGNDQLKANAVQTFKTKGVTSFKTV